MSDKIRYELDAPMRKVRADLGLDPLEPEPPRSTDKHFDKPSAIIEFNRSLTAEEQQRIRKEWERRLSGPGVGRRPLILDSGKFTGSTGPR